MPRGFSSSAQIFRIENYRREVVNIGETMSHFRTRPSLLLAVKSKFYCFYIFGCLFVSITLVAFTSKTCPDIDCLPEVVSVSVTPAAESKSRPRDRRRISLSTEKILEGNYMCIAHSQLVVFRPCSLLKMYFFKYFKIEKKKSFSQVRKM